MKNRVLQQCVMLILLVSHALAQQSQTLDELDEKIKRHFEGALPGWKHERVEPFMKSETVLVEFWSLSNRKVKVSIMSYKSVEEARDVFKNHEKYSSNKELMRGLGDEAVASGYGSSEVAFRRGRHIVFISTTADVEADPDARGLTQSQMNERQKSEMRRLSREFAKHIADALSGP